MKKAAKIFVNVLAVLSALSGGIWLLQGIGVLPGSFMTGQTRWAVNGGLLLTASLIVLFFNNRPRRRMHD